MPTLNPNIAGGLVELAIALTGSRLKDESQRVRIIILGIVLVPEETSLSQGAALVRAYRTMLRYIPPTGETHERVEVQTEVRVAREVWQGIADHIHDEKADMVLLHWKGDTQTPGRIYGATLDNLLANPPCDIVLARFSATLNTIKNILLPVRGGSYNTLALQLASNLAESWSAETTILHSSENVRYPMESEDPDNFDDSEGDDEPLALLQNILPEMSSAARLIRLQGTPVFGILQEAARHDLLILGASNLTETNPADNITRRIVTRTDKPILVVCTRQPLELLRPGGLAVAVPPTLPEQVDRWFAENTFHYREFRSMSSLTIIKERNNLSISLILPVYGDLQLAGLVLLARKAWRALIWDCALVDELIISVPDGRFNAEDVDRFYKQIGAQANPVMREKILFCLPETNRRNEVHKVEQGPAESIWQALRRVRGDIVVWADPTMRDFEARRIYGPVGPLLSYPEFQLAVGFYSDESLPKMALPVRNDLSEFSLRPMLGSAFPLLAGIIDPACTVGAARRELLEHIPFFTGPAFSMGLTIDTFNRGGLRSITQVDLGNEPTNHSLVRPQRVTSDLLAILFRRLAERNQTNIPLGFNPAVKIIRKSDGVFSLKVEPQTQRELPPVAYTAGYKRQFFEAAAKFELEEENES